MSKIAKNGQREMKNPLLWEEDPQVNPSNYLTQKTKEEKES